MMRAPILFLFFFFFIFFFSSISSSATDTITPSHPLSNGETLISANGTFALGFFTPPNTTNRYLGIWHHNLPVQTVVWVANRRNPIPNLNATLSLAAHNASLHLIITSDKYSTPIWSSPSFPNPIAQLLDTGNLVVKSPNSTSILWQSFDHPTDTLLPGMKFGPNLKTGIDRNLTSWLTPSDPSPGKYTLAIDPIGVPQLVIRAAPSGGWIWRGGPWNGFGFSGADPDHFFDLALYREFISGFKSTPEEIYYYFNSVGDAISLVRMDQNGTDRRYEWQASSQQWNLVWLAPSDACDFFLACGNNAVCDASSSSICRCLDGFDPRSPVSWGRGDWSDGCVRAEALGCGANGTDEFVVVGASKLPDTTEAVADMSLDLDGCRTRCLMNCSCKAYARADLSAGGSGCIIWMAEIRDLRVYANGGQDLYVRVASRSKDVEHGLKLEWTSRFQIIEGIAQGLLYLHKHSRLRVIHRDLKASNILLDADMNPKISDFGMARIFDANETQVNTRRIVGTYGYMSPEYAFKGFFSVKSDVFSFGVLLLEIVSGKRNTGFHEFGSWCNLLAYAWDLWNKGNWMELADPALDDKFQHDEVARCIYVALLCVQENSDDRPVMTDIVNMLSNESLYFNSVKQPAFFTMKNTSDSKWPLNLHVNTSSNGLSISAIAGR